MVGSWALGVYLWLVKWELMAGLGLAGGLGGGYTGCL